MFTTTCPTCGEPFTGTSLRDTLEARRFHNELRHIEGKIETDT